MIEPHCEVNADGSWDLIEPDGWGDQDVSVPIALLRELVEARSLVGMVSIFNRRAF